MTMFTIGVIVFICISDSTICSSNAIDPSKLANIDFFHEIQLNRIFVTKKTHKVFAYNKQFSITIWFNKHENIVWSIILWIKHNFVC